MTKTPSRPDRTHPLAPHLPEIRTDLATVTDGLRWAATDAWWPTTTDPDAPRGVPALAVVTPSSTDPDIVKGHRYDLGVADDMTRRALVVTVAHLGTIEIRLAFAVHESGRRWQPPLDRPEPTASHPQLEQTITACRWRLGTLEADALDLAKPTITRIRTHLRAAHHASDLAVRVLDGAFSRGDTGGVAHAAPKCRICGIRPRAEREQQVSQPNGSRRTIKRATKGGRCDTCAKWFERNGDERPRALDQDSVDDAIEAAGRRRARGEGWGAA